MRHGACKGIVETSFTLDKRPKVLRKASMRGVRVRWLIPATSLPASRQVAPLRWRDLPPRTPMEHPRALPARQPLVRRVRFAISNAHMPWAAAQRSNRSCHPATTQVFALPEQLMTCTFSTSELARGRKSRRWASHHHHAQPTQPPRLATWSSCRCMHAHSVSAHASCMITAASAQAHASVSPLAVHRAVHAAA